MATETTSGVSLRGVGFYVSALPGAVVTVLTSFLPVAPVFGGAVAGHLHDAGTGRGTRAGAVSGVLASLPLAALYPFILSVFVFGSITSGEVAGPAFVAVLVGGIFLLVVLYTVGLGALGGYVGARYAESRVTKRDATRTDGDETTADETPADGTPVDAGPTADETPADGTPVDAGPTADGDQ